MRMKKRNGIAVALLIWMVIGSMISGISGRAKASPNTVVKLCVQPEPPKVDVSPESSGIVTLTGTVYCLKYGPDDVKVSLGGSSNFGGVKVIPPTMIIAGTGGAEESRTFAVTTRVPMGTLASGKGSITVSGSFIQGDLQYPISTVSQFIEIEPFYKMEADKPQTQEAREGEFVYIPIKMTNLGNTEDTYEFQFLNLKDLANKQWTVATITPKHFLAGQTQTLIVSAQVPFEDDKEGDYIQPFTLKILSQQSFEEGGSVKYDVRLHVIVRENPFPTYISPFLFGGFVAITMVFAWKGWDRGMKDAGGLT
jgi:hypothetical protein